MKSHTKTARLYATVIALAFIAPALVAGSTAFAADAAASEPLAMFRPGAPGEPSWNVLRLGVDRPGTTLQVRVDDSAFRCPFAWSFVLYQGAPSEAVVRASVTIDFAYGHNGARLHVDGPVDVAYDDVEHDGATACETGGGGITINFLEVPGGDLHLLQYKAGTSFAGEAELRAPRGGLRVLEESSGERVIYLGSSDFGRSDTHVEVYGPRGCGSPSLDSEASFCKTGYHWPGGVIAGAEVATRRGAAVSFIERPYFFVGAGSNVVGVTNATVQNPLGHVTTIYASTGLAAGNTAVSLGGIRYSTSSVVENPPGEYVVRVEMNANVGTTAVPWHLAGADFHFPGEGMEAAR